MSRSRRVLPLVVDILLLAVVVSVTIWKGSAAWHWMISVSGFIFLHILFRVSLLSRVRMLSKLSFRDINRRKTSSALLLIGLMLSSAVVSSSLIVGDSFDATLEDRLVASLGETDWTVEGIDPLTSSPLLMNQTRIMAALNEILKDEEIDGIGIELHQSATGIAPDGSKVDPNVVWLAPDVNLRATGPWGDPVGVPHITWSQIGHEIVDGVENAVINEALANSLNLKIDDEFSLSWPELIENETNRREHSFKVQSIVEPIGLGWETANQPLLITSLERAQEIQNKADLVTRAVISGNGGVFEGHLISSVEDKIEDAFADAMISSDAGFVWNEAEPGEIATLTRTSGGGLLSSGDVSGINSALKIIEHDSDAGSFLLTPISGIWDEEGEVTSLDGEVVIAINLDENSSTVVTDQGVYIFTRIGVEAEFIFSNILDAEFSGSEIYVLTNEEIIEVNLSSMDSSIIVDNAYGISSISVSGSKLFGVASASAQSSFFQMDLSSSQRSFEVQELDFQGDPIGSRISSDGDLSLILFQTFFNSQLCWISDPSPFCLNVGDSNMVFVHRNEIFIETPSSIEWWNGSDFQEVLALESLVLGASGEGLLLEGEESVMVWSSTSLTFVEGFTTPPGVDGTAFVELNGSVHASTSYGTVMVESNGNISLELFSTFDVGLGIQLPPFLLALEGEMVSNFVGENDTIRFRNEIINPHSVETYYLGKNMDNESRIEVKSDSQGVVLDEFLWMNSDLDMLAPAIIGTISIDLAGDLLGGIPRRTMILVEMPQDEENTTIVMQALHDWADRRADISSSVASLNTVKADSIKSIEGAGASFSALFLIFGTFLVIAGLLLIVNLWIMSADDRSEQWGLLRAIGASSHDIEWLLRIEGAILAIPGCILGSILGLGLAALLMGGFGAFFEATFGVGFSFAWTSKSLIIGAISGFLLSVFTLRISSFVLSRRNSISSLRGLSTDNSAIKFWGIVSAIFFSVGAFVCLIMSFVLNDLSPSLGHSLLVSGVSLLLLVLVFPVEWMLRKFLPQRPKLLGFELSREGVSWRLSSSIVGMLIIMCCILLSSDERVTDTSLIISGVFLLVSGVMIASSLGALVMRRLLFKVAESRPIFSAVFSLSISYPQSRPLRTAASMGMYSIVVFALIALSGYSALFAGVVSDLGDNSRGEFDILMTGSGQDLDTSPLLAWSEDDLERNGIDSLVIMDVGLCIIRGEDTNATYSSLRGIPTNFLDAGALPLSEWDQSLGNTQLEVWEAILSNPNLAIVDASIGLDSYSVLGALPVEGKGISSGSMIEMRDPLRPMVQTNLRVAGVLTEDASLLMSGVLVSSSTFSSLSESSTGMAWIAVSDETHVDEIASNLQLEFGSDGANVLVVDELFDQIRVILVSLLGLLRVFLALGLLIGVSGLAVVTARSINQRKQQIGVLRAIGMQSRQIVTSILMEVGWISGLGTINGFLAGLVFHRLLFKTYIEGEGTIFVIPWAEFISIILLSLFMTLVAVWLPVRRGAQIPPTQAMRSF